MIEWGSRIIGLAFGSESIGIQYLFECRSFGGDIVVLTEFLVQVIVGGCWLLCVSCATMSPSVVAAMARLSKALEILTTELAP